MVSKSLIKKDETMLYMVEFFICQLNINSNIVESINSDHLSIHIKFLDFPALVINKNEFVTSATDSKNHFSIFIFNTGKSLVFSEHHQKFLDSVQNRPVKLMVIEWIPNANIYSAESKNDSLIGKADVHLSEYLCDEISTEGMSQKQPFNLYKLRNIFQLSNRNNNVSGTIDIFIRITCFEKYLMTQFHMNNGKFVFKNSDSTTVSTCSKVMNKKTNMKNEYKEVCLSDSYFKRTNQDLKSKIIQRLSLICEDFPNKLERESSPTKYVTHNGIKKENFSVNEKNKELFEDKKRERMRGGGLNEELEKFSALPVSSGKIFSDDFYKLKHEKHQSECGCYGECTAKTMGSGLECMDTPYTRLDSLMQKLKETQEFVNSLGKVPGMQGLGLMDPAESPYFNRNCQKLNLTENQFLLSNEKKQSDLVMKTQKKLQNFPGMYDFPYEQKFTINSSKKSLLTPIKKLQQEEKIKQKDDQSASITTEKVKHRPCGKVTCMSRTSVSKDDFSQYHEQTSSSKILKKTKLQKRQSKSSKKTSKQVSCSQSLDLKPKDVQISKKILKLVNSTRSRFCYGHKSCVDVRMRVPGNMGWLWNTRETLGKLKPQVGWKPGAISRNVCNLLEDAKIGRTSEEIRNRPLTPVRGKKAKGTKRKHLFFPSKHYWGHKARDDEYQLPPTLHIQRKNGDYYVTFYPINKELTNQPEEQQTIKPLHFHLRKQKNPDFLDDSSSAASDMEIEFSPPTVTTRYQEKPDTRDADTLVYQNDIIESVKEILPEIQSKKTKKKKSKSKLADKNNH